MLRILYCSINEEAGGNVRAFAVVRVAMLSIHAVVTDLEAIP